MDKRKGMQAFIFRKLFKYEIIFDTFHFEIINIILIFLEANKVNKTIKFNMKFDKLEFNMPMNSIMKKKFIKVGSLFAGIGGFCKAFEMEGAKVIWANDNDVYVEKTYTNNFKNRFILKDIYELSVTKDSLNPVDVLTAGFPCQPFSIAGFRKGFDDPRGNVFFQIVRIINEFNREKPKILLLENVKNFRQEKYLSKVIFELNKAGYWCDENFIKVLNTHELTDLPQNRERLFIIALNKDYFDNKPLPFPEKEIGKKIKPYKFLNTKKKAEDYYYFKPKTKYWILFKEKMDKYDDDKRKNIYLLRRWYVRSYLNGTTPTLTANMGTGGHNVPVIRDKWGIRKFTIEECAALQGFDDSWFKIPSNVSKSQIYKQIGNSVTIPLINKLAKICCEAVRKINGK